MAESREHQRLVSGLVRHLQSLGVVVIAADAPGWRRTPLVGGRRPDVVGYHPAGRYAVAGEAKRGPEIWSCRAQIVALADALPARGPIGGGALLVLAVGEGWEDDATDFCRTLTPSMTSTHVWSPAA